MQIILVVIVKNLYKLIQDRQTDNKKEKKRCVLFMKFWFHLV